MPTYDYMCNDCENIFEVFHSISDNPEIECKNCKSLNTERKISQGAGFILKGSGFYTTDYKRKEEKPKECHETSTCSNSCPHKKSE